MGTLGDRIGRRRLLLIGAAAFGARLDVAAFSTQRRDADRDARAARRRRRDAGAVDAVADPQHVPRRARAPVAIGVWIASFSVGGAIGPLVGGVLLQYFWWGSVFLVAVPVMVLLLLLGPVLLPEYRDPRRRPARPRERALSLVAVLAMIYGLKQIAEHGFGWGRR